MKTAIIIAMVTMSLQSGIAQESMNVEYLGQVLPRWGTVYDMELAGNALFVANSRFDILDVSDPTDPEYLHFTSRLGYCWEVEVVGERAYVRLRDYSNIRKLAVFDVSDLTEPRLLGEYPEDQFYFSDMIVKGTTACFRSRNLIHILDVADPANIRQTATIDSSADFILFGEEDNYLYTCKSRLGVRVFDLTDPANPSQIGFFPVEFSVADIAFSDRRLFLLINTYRNFGVTVLDVADPRNIANLAHILTGNSEPELLTVCDTLIFIGGESFFGRIGIADLNTPTFIGLYGNGRNNPKHFAQNSASLFMDDGALEVYNSLVGDELEPIGILDNSGQINSVKIAGDRMYAGGMVIDLTEPLSPRELWKVPIENIADVEFEGDNFHVITDSRYRVYDISNPENPVQKSVFGVGGQDILLNGDFAYVSRYGINGQDTLDILDISDLSYIKHVETIDADQLAGCAGKMKQIGNYLYSLSGSCFGILDVSDPTAPSLVSSYPDLFFASDFCVEGDFAYILNEKSMVILNVSSPNALQLVSDTLEFVGHAVTVAENHLLLSGWNKNIRILSLETPTRPSLAGKYKTHGEAMMAAVKDGICYVADNTSLMMLDYSDALSTHKDFSAIPVTLFLSAFPNPFNSSVTIFYSLPGSGRYALDVVDLQGRLVTRLSDGWKETGSYREVFQADNLASGEYLIRMNLSGESVALPLTLIK